jgi:hypothetical protein
MIFLAPCSRRAYADGTLNVDSASWTILGSQRYNCVNLRQKLGTGIPKEELGSGIRADSAR